MFDEIPQSVLDRMSELEQIDAQDRSDGTTRLKRLRQIPSETGKFIALLAATAPSGRYLEIGTVVQLYSEELTNSVKMKIKEIE